jgi:dienelactone hydrolase
MTLSFQAVSAKIVSRTVDYTDEQGTTFEGYLVYNDTISGERPGILVIHDWRGLTDTTQQHCEVLAKLGYAAFAADIYGKGIRPQSISEYGKQATIYKNNRPLFRERANAAYEALLKQPEVDPSKTAAIGYCFGGTGVIELARDGAPLLGVVSFHGGLDSSPMTSGKIFTSKVLALCGADDPFEKPADMEAFEHQLKDLHVDYQIVKYSGAEHAFTDKGVDALNIPGARYNAAADRRSWQAMQDFFAELFQSPTPPSG